MRELRRPAPRALRHDLSGGKLELRRADRPGCFLLQTPEGRLYHSRALRTKYNGDFKPFVKRLRKLQEDGLSLTEVAVPGKHIYTYALQGKQQPTRLPYPKGA